AGTRRAPASAAGAGSAAFPLQHTRERAGAGRCRLAARVGRAAEPHRVPARRGTGTSRARRHDRARAAAGSTVSRADADAHARSPGVRHERRPGGAARSLSPDDGVDAGRECRAARHRSQRRRRPDRHRRRAGGRTLRGARHRHRRRAPAVGQRSRNRAHDVARAAAADLRRCRAAAADLRRAARRRRRSRSPGANMTAHATALIADDEPLLREALRRQLAAVWPELEIVAEARNGRDAVKLFDERHPDICFLDVHMPGLSGVDAANHIGRRAHLVFVTAYDHYAVQAFAQGALDYLLKPVEPARLADTVSRLKERLQSSRPAINTEQLLRQLSEQLATLQSGGGARHEALRWIRAQAGKTVRLIAIDDVDYLRSDAKYTIVAWRDGAKAAEAVVRTPLKELLERLDAKQFAQVHRSVVVNLRAISHVKRHDNETAEIHVKGRDEVLPVSRNYLHLFRQM